MRNYFNYFTEVEEYFIRKRGKNLLVSPLDWCLIELWKDSGIPLNVVLRGIDRGFETLERRRSRPPRSLFYCHPAVLEAFEEHQQAMLGTSALDTGEQAQAEDEGLSRKQVLESLKRLLSSLGRNPGEACSRARKRLASLIDDLKAAEQVGYERVDRELSEIGAALADNLLKEMSDEEASRLRKEVRSETRLYKKRLDEKMFRRLESGYLQRRVLELNGLPPFSLFSFDE